jgi:hypothetical protein
VQGAEPLPKLNHMKTTFNRNCLWFLLLACLVGCTPLKEVGSFTESIQKILLGVTLHYGSQQFCRDSCLIYNPRIKELKELSCNCSVDSLKDSVILTECTILGSYYTGLTKLSGASLINFAPIGKSVQKGNYGGFTVNDAEANTFNTLSTVAADLVTLEYKTRKIKEIFSTNNAGVQNALGILLVKLDNLRGFIEVMRIKFKQTNTVLIHEATTESERVLLANTYKEKNDRLLS